VRYDHEQSQGRRREPVLPDQPAREAPRRSGPTDAWLASRAALSGTLHREALGPLQRSIGNTRVQRLIAVQRKENQLDEKDIDPELMKDLDSRFQLTEGDNQLDEKDIDPELMKDLDSRFQLTGGNNQLDEKDIDPELMKDLDSRFHLTGEESKEAGGPTNPVEGQRSELSASRAGRRPETKKKKGGIGKAIGKVGKKVGAFFQGTANAYKKGGLHQVLTQRNKNLNLAKRRLKEGRLGDVRLLAGKKGILEDATTKQMVVYAITSPIVFARLAAENSKAKKIQKKLQEMEEG